MPLRVPEGSGPGWVYVLICPDFPGYRGIVGTERAATDRAVELVTECGAVESFTVVDRHAVADWFTVEQVARRMLSDRRLPRSELFQCTSVEASRVVRAAAMAYEQPWAAAIWLRPSAASSAFNAPIK